MVQFKYNNIILYYIVVLIYHNNNYYYNNSRTFMYIHDKRFRLLRSNDNNTSCHRRTTIFVNVLILQLERDSWRVLFVYLDHTHICIPYYIWLYQSHHPEDTSTSAFSNRSKRQRWGRSPTRYNVYARIYNVTFGTMVWIMSDTIVRVEQRRFRFFPLHRLSLI